MSSAKGRNNRQKLHLGRSGSATLDCPLLPDPFTSAKLVETVPFESVSTVDDLREWLRKNKLEVDLWGQGDTKTVGKYWKELQGNEAGLELYELENGEIQVMRVTHVLRAKVCSRESYERGVFLMNSWQQFGDGRTRTRNGLLSEKLTIDEMPLVMNLHPVCARAVTEEEMQRVCPAEFRIEEGCPPPKFDADYVCPLEVVDEVFVDHTVEIEPSKSYPGLMTIYHLYTVDIICTGLPQTDFNTLEFDHEDANGARKLKYVHAWVWMEWPKIQRYLFKDSELKQRYQKGSFKNADVFAEFLGKWDLELHEWGCKEDFKPVSALFDELEKQETYLEVWSRQDGVSLLMRVAHVVQLQVFDPQRDSRFLMMVSKLVAKADLMTKILSQATQPDDELTGAKSTSCANLVTKMMNTSSLPFSREVVTEVAQEAVKKNLSYLKPANFVQVEGATPVQSELPVSDVRLVSAKFIDHRCVVDQSPSFWKLPTMYHLYSVESQCSGLPEEDFTSLTFKGQFITVIGWRWARWHEMMDVLNARAAQLERMDASCSSQLEAHSSRFLGTLDDVVKRLGDRLDAEDADVLEAKHLVQQLQSQMRIIQQGAKAKAGEVSMHLPPDMIAKMSDEMKIECNAIPQRSSQTSRSIPPQSIIEYADEAPSSASPSGSFWGSGFACCASQKDTSSVSVASIFSPAVGGSREMINAPSDEVAVTVAI